jgi:predicted DNA-binding transcriptional regulator
MVNNNLRIDKTTERAVHDLLKSQVEARIYLYLLRKNRAQSEDIIRGTRLHPSTVREFLSKMYRQKLICREKLKNGCIGKNPYLYHAIPPKKLLQKYIRELEETLNKIAHLANKPKTDTQYVRIIIHGKTEDT